MDRSVRTRGLILAVVAVVGCVADAHAQGKQKPDPNLKPTFGSVQLSAGFSPDPFVKDLQAGGNIHTGLGGVKTHVAAAPDFSLNYTRGKGPLVFSAKSVGDTTLLINLPDGTWIADDDSGGGLDPLINIPNPASGRYDIYVGTYQRELVAATLHISNGELIKKPVVPVNSNLPECFIVSAGVDNYRNANKLKGCLNDARNTVAAFRGQVGGMFRGLKEQILLDDQAEHNAILSAFAGLTQKGAAGDTMVLFLSGHGARTSGNKGPMWFFLPVDYHPKNFLKTSLTDKKILDVADQLVRQKKNVVVIVDACFSGQLGVTAQQYLQQYQATNQGGLILMLSSSPEQTSTALGNYSAYAKAFFDAMTGAGDLNKDSKITLSEIKNYSYKHTFDLLKGARIDARQDSSVVWSPSYSKDATFAHAGKTVVASTKPLPSEAPTRWTGSETLPGFGKLTFSLYTTGRVIMEDAKSTTEGHWRREGNQYTLSFANGAVVYTGTVEGKVLSGTATSPSSRQDEARTWNWTVRQ